MPLIRLDTGGGCLLHFVLWPSLFCFVVWFFACLIGGQCQ